MISIVGPDPSQIHHQNILDFLGLRKREFIDRLGWQLTHSDTAEWDEYDLPNALFVVAYKDGQCVGGARLLRTDSTTPRKGNSPLSFMLADFLSGKLPIGMNIDDMNRSFETGSDVWEMTRFVGSPIVTHRILRHVNTYLAQMGARSVLTISPKLMPKALERLGYTVHVLSKPIVFDGKEYVALETEIQHMAAE